MSLENELSYDEMKQIRINELSSLIIDAYNNANQQITFSKEPSLKLKWKCAQVNAEKQHYLIYLDKYMNGDKSLFRSIRDYLQTYYEGVAKGENDYEQTKLYSEQQKITLLKYTAISGVVFSAIIPLVVIPAVAASIFYLKKSLDLRIKHQKIELDMAFKEAAIEDIKELKESDLELALMQSIDKLKK